MARRPPVLLRVVLAAIRTIAILVPRRDRDTWRREWEGEILHGHSVLTRTSSVTWRDQMSIARHASGSLADAAWLRRQFTRDSELVHDLRHAARLVRRGPLFYLLAALILAIGIGSTAATYTLLDRLVIHALPYPAPEALVGLWQRNTTTGNTHEEIAPGNFLDWRAEATTFADLAAAEPYSVDYTGGDRPEVLFTTRVTEGFFDVLRVRPLHGRLFQPGDHLKGADRLAVISHAFWQRLGADTQLVGRAVSLDGQPYTVIGVLPPRAEINLFDERGERDVWLPKAIEEHEKAIRGGGWWAAIGRLRPGASRAQAQADLDRISARLATAHPRTNATTTVGVEPLETQLTRTVRPALIVMLAAVVLVLIIACANVANLLLVRAGERTREFALRGALGASRARLLRQSITESALLAGVATLAATAVAWATLRAAVALAPVQSSRIADITMDWRVLALVALVGAASTLLFGVLPAWHIARRSRLETGDGRTTSGSRRSRSLRDSLVVVEVAVAVVLAIAVGLLLRSFTSLLRIDPGFSQDRIAVVQLFMWDRHSTEEKLSAFMHDALDRLSGLPGVVAIGGVSAMPFIEANIGIESPFGIEGRPPARPGEEPTTHLTVATPGYFDVMDIPVVHGRGLAATDGAAQTPVAVVTRSLADRHWPNGDALGAWVTFRFRGQPQRRQVVGIVSEVRHDALELPPRDEIFVPFAQAPFGSMTLVMKSKTDAASLIEPAKAAIWSLDPMQTIYDSATVADLLATSVAPRRFALTIAGVYAGVALCLAALGIYGVMTVSTRQRTREIGVRVALGATSSTVMRMVLTRTLVLAGVGLVIGIGAALGVSRWLDSLLYGVSPTDPATLAGVAVVVVMAAALAGYAPARRAARVDPLTALRE